MSKKENRHSLSNMLREKGGEKKNPTLADEELEQGLSSTEKKRSAPDKVGSNKIKNLLFLIVFIVLPVFSYYDYINLPFLGKADGNASTEIMSDLEQGFTDGYNDEDKTLTNENLTTSHNDYRQKLNNGELGKAFPGWEIDHLYKSAVPISFLEGLHQADMINQFEFWEISTLFGNGVKQDYLSALDRAGLLSTWQAWEIGNLYEDGVPASYLSELSDADVLTYFSAAEIAQLFDSGITAAQLATISVDLNLNEATVDEIINWK